eukprot:TRINITY_DN1188_c0_g1_i2.p1 TRINITY_DN1188_c0_g1~~TRINITY_DN1188_c0_g1_i2.p1  ORF type:complete len:160 (+),score=34.51 TRINITY_DN1188_c0_g1_i2:88-567(+)
MRKPVNVTNGVGSSAKLNAPPVAAKVNGDDCDESEESGELPELPTEPGCYVHAPKKCAKRPVMDTDWYSDNHRGSATNEAVCKARAAEFDRWCPTTGTIAEFVGKVPDPTDEECSKKKLSKDGCREIGCSYREDLGVCERDCGRSNEKRKSTELRGRLV